MKNKLLALFLALVAMFSLFGLVACGEEEDTNNDQPQVEVDYGTLSVEDVTLGIGKTKTIIANFSKADYSSLPITYTFNGNGISIANGEVTGLAVGKVEVTATTEHHSDTFEVNVIDTGFAIADVVLGIGKTATINPVWNVQANATAITYSYDGDVISINNGVITANKEGEAIVTAKSAEYETTFKVTVNDYAFTIENMEIVVGEDAVINVAWADNSLASDIAYTYNGTNVINIVTGEVTGLAVGEVEVTAKTAEYTTTFVVKVVQNNIAIENITLKVGESANIIATWDKADYATEITYTEDSDKISIVDGAVIAGSMGEATVTATTANGATTTFKVTVIKPDYVGEVSIDTMKIPYGVAVEIIPEFSMPEYAEELTYIVSDPSVAVVENGYITGLVGDAQVTVVAKSESFSTMFTVNVGTNYGELVIADVDVVIGCFANIIYDFSIDKFAGEIEYILPEDAPIAIENGVVVVNEGVTAASSVEVIAVTELHETVFTVNVYTQDFLGEAELVDYNERLVDYDNNSLSDNSNQATLFVGDQYLDLESNGFMTYSENLAGVNAYNLAVKGTTAGQWAMYGQGFYDYAPLNVVITAGINDIKAYGAEKAISNVIAMLNAYHVNMPNTFVYWYTIVPAKDVEAADIVAVNEAILAYAEENATWLTVVEIYDDLAADANNFKADGIALSEAGYEIAVEALGFAGIRIYNEEATSWLSRASQNLRQNRVAYDVYADSFVWSADLKIVEKANNSHISIELNGSSNWRFLIWDSNNDDAYIYGGAYNGSYKGDSANKLVKGDDDKFPTINVIVAYYNNNLYLIVDGVLQEVMVDVIAFDYISISSEATGVYYNNVYSANAINNEVLDIIVAAGFASEDEVYLTGNYKGIVEAGANKGILFDEDFTWNGKGVAGGVSYRDLWVNEDGFALEGDFAFTYDFVNDPAMAINGGGFITAQVNAAGAMHKDWDNSGMFFQDLAWGANAWNWQIHQDFSNRLTAEAVVPEGAPIGHNVKVAVIKRAGTIYHAIGIVDGENVAWYVSTNNLGFDKVEVRISVENLSVAISNVAMERDVTEIDLLIASLTKAEIAYVSISSNNLDGSTGLADGTVVTLDKVVAEGDAAVQYVKTVSKDGFMLNNLVAGTYVVTVEGYDPVTVDLTTIGGFITVNETLFASSKDYTVIAGEGGYTIDCTTHNATAEFAKAANGMVVSFIFNAAKTTSHTQYAYPQFEIYDSEGNKSWVQIMGHLGQAYIKIGQDNYLTYLGSIDYINAKGGVEIQYVVVNNNIAIVVDGEFVGFGANTELVDVAKAQLVNYLEGTKTQIDWVYNNFTVVYGDNELFVNAYAYDMDTYEDINTKIVLSNYTPSAFETVEFTAYIPAGYKVFSVSAYSAEIDFVVNGNVLTGSFIANGFTFVEIALTKVNEFSVYYEYGAVDVEANVAINLADGTAVTLVREDGLTIETVVENGAIVATLPVIYQLAGWDFMISNYTVVVEGYEEATISFYIVEEYDYAIWDYVYSLAVNEYEIVLDKPILANVDNNATGWNVNIDANGLDINKPANFKPSIVTLNKVDTSDLVVMTIEMHFEQNNGNWSTIYMPNGKNLNVGVWGSNFYLKPNGQNDGAKSFNVRDNANMLYARVLVIIEGNDIDVYYYSNGALTYAFNLDQNDANHVNYNNPKEITIQCDDMAGYISYENITLLEGDAAKAALAGNVTVGETEQADVSISADKIEIGKVFTITAVPYPEKVGLIAVTAIKLNGVAIEMTVAKDGTATANYITNEFVGTDFVVTVETDIVSAPVNVAIDLTTEILGEEVAIEDGLKATLTLIDQYINLTYEAVVADGKAVFADVIPGNYVLAVDEHASTAIFAVVGDEDANFEDSAKLIWNPLRQRPFDDKRNDNDTIDVTNFANGEIYFENDPIGARDNCATSYFDFDEKLGKIVYLSATIYEELPDTNWAENSLTMFMFNNTGDSTFPYLGARWVNSNHNEDKTKDDNNGEFQYRMQNGSWTSVLIKKVAVGTANPNYTANIAIMVMDGTAYMFNVNPENGEHTLIMSRGGGYEFINGFSNDGWRLRLTNLVLSTELPEVDFAIDVEGEGSVTASGTVYSNAVINVEAEEGYVLDKLLFNGQDVTSKVYNGVYEAGRYDKTSATVEASFIAYSDVAVDVTFDLDYKWADKDEEFAVEAGDWFYIVDANGKALAYEATEGGLAVTLEPGSYVLESDKYYAVAFTVDAVEDGVATIELDLVKKIFVDDFNNKMSDKHNIAYDENGYQWTTKTTKSDLYFVDGLITEGTIMELEVNLGTDGSYLDDQLFPELYVVPSSGYANRIVLQFCVWNGTLYIKNSVANAPLPNIVGQYQSGNYKGNFYVVFRDGDMFLYDDTGANLGGTGAAAGKTVSDYANVYFRLDGGNITNIDNAFLYDDIKIYNIVDAPITVNEVENAEVSVDVDSISNFETANITATAAEGYVVTAVTVNGAKVATTLNADGAVVASFTKMDGATEYVVDVTVEEEAITPVKVTVKSKFAWGSDETLADVAEGTVIKFTHAVTGSSYLYVVGADSKMTVKLPLGDYVVSADGYYDSALKITDGTEEDEDVSTNAIIQIAAEIVLKKSLGRDDNINGAFDEVANDANGAVIAKPNYRPYGHSQTDFYLDLDLSAGVVVFDIWMKYEVNATMCSMSYIVFPNAKYVNYGCWQGANVNVKPENRNDLAWIWTPERAENSTYAYYENVNGKTYINVYNLIVAYANGDGTYTLDWWYEGEHGLQVMKTSATAIDQFSIWEHPSAGEVYYNFKVYEGVDAVAKATEVGGNVTTSSNYEAVVVNAPAVAPYGVAVPVTVTVNEVEGGFYVIESIKINSTSVDFEVVDGVATVYLFASTLYHAQNIEVISHFYPDATVTVNENANATIEVSDDALTFGDTFTISVKVADADDNGYYALNKLYANADELAFYLEDGVYYAEVKHDDFVDLASANYNIVAEVIYLENAAISVVENADATIEVSVETVANGESFTITATPIEAIETGYYEVTAITVNGVEVDFVADEAGVATVNYVHNADDVTSYEVAVVVAFRQTATVIVAEDLNENATVEVAADTVLYGESIVITVTPIQPADTNAAGDVELGGYYVVYAINVNGIDYYDFTTDENGVVTLILTHISEALEYVVFARTQFMKDALVTVPAEVDGATVVSDKEVVIFGASAKVTITVEEFYTLMAVSVNGDAVSATDNGDNTYTLIVTHDDNDIQEYVVEVAVERLSEVTYTLTHNKLSDNGNAVPAGVKATLAGETTYNGTVGEDGVLFIQGVSAGSYVLTLENYTNSISVTVVEGEDVVAEVVVDYKTVASEHLTENGSSIDASDINNGSVLINSIGNKLAQIRFNEDLGEIKYVEFTTYEPDYQEGIYPGFDVTGACFFVKRSGGGIDGDLGLNAAANDKNWRIRWQNFTWSALVNFRKDSPIGAKFCNHEVGIRVAGAIIDGDLYAFLDDGYGNLKLVGTATDRKGEDFVSFAGIGAQQKNTKFDNIVISTEIPEVLKTINKNIEDAGNVEITSSAFNAPATVKVTTNEGFVLDSVMVNNQLVTLNENGEYTVDNLGYLDIVVDVNWTDWNSASTDNNVTVNNGDIITVVRDNSEGGVRGEASITLEGNVAIINVTTNEGYRLNSLLVDGVAVDLATFNGVIEKVVTGKSIAIDVEWVTLTNTVMEVLYRYAYMTDDQALHLANKTLTLTGPVNYTVTTDEYGEVVFYGIPDGEYLVYFKEYYNMYAVAEVRNGEFVGPVVIEAVFFSPGGNVDTWHKTINPGVGYTVYERDLNKDAWQNWGWLDMYGSTIASDKIIHVRLRDDIYIKNNQAKGAHKFFYEVRFNFPNGSFKNAQIVNWGVGMWVVKTSSGGGTNVNIKNGELKITAGNHTNFGIYFKFVPGGAEWYNEDGEFITATLWNDMKEAPSAMTMYSGGDAFDANSNIRLEEVKGWNFMNPEFHSETKLDVINANDFFQYAYVIPAVNNDEVVTSITANGAKLPLVIKDGKVAGAYKVFGNVNDVDVVVTTAKVAGASVTLSAGSTLGSWEKYGDALANGDSVALTNADGATYVAEVVDGKITITLPDGTYTASAVGYVGGSTVVVADGVANVASVNVYKDLISNHNKEDSGYKFVDDGVNTSITRTAYHRGADAYLTNIDYSGKWVVKFTLSAARKSISYGGFLTPAGSHRNFGTWNNNQFEMGNKFTWDQAVTTTINGAEYWNTEMFFVGDASSTTIYYKNKSGALVNLWSETGKTNDKAFGFVTDDCVNERSYLNLQAYDGQDAIDYIASLGL